MWLFKSTVRNERFEIFRNSYKLLVSWKRTNIHQNINVMQAIFPNFRDIYQILQSSEKFSETPFFLRLSEK